MCGLGTCAFWQRSSEIGERELTKGRLVACEHGEIECMWQVDATDESRKVRCALEM